MHAIAIAMRTLQETNPQGAPSQAAVSNLVSWGRGFIHRHQNRDAAAPPVRTKGVDGVLKRVA